MKEEKQFLIYLIRQFNSLLRYIAKSLRAIKKGEDFQKLSNYVEKQFDLYNKQLIDFGEEVDNGEPNKL